MRFRDFESTYPNIHASRIPSTLTVLIALWLWYYWKLKLLPRENSLKNQTRALLILRGLFRSWCYRHADSRGCLSGSLQCPKAQAQCTKIDSNMGFAVRSCRDMERLTEGTLALSWKEQGNRWSTCPWQWSSPTPYLHWLWCCQRRGLYLVQNQPSEAWTFGGKKRLEFHHSVPIWEEAKGH